jgi:sulfur dioxygenase
MIFKQLLEVESSTYTYLIGCQETGKSVLIDPVLETVDRDLQVIEALGLTLDFTLETHVHADHITGAQILKSRTQCQIAFPDSAQVGCADIRITESENFMVGNITVQPIFTPGHTNHHHAYLVNQNNQGLLFSGDALFIDACGRTDFQEGDAQTLYQSVVNKLFTLPDETLVYPGHDYSGRFVSSIIQEKTRNPYFSNNKSQAEFVELMSNLDLPYPKKMKIAVPSNLQCGLPQKSNPLSKAS